VESGQDDPLVELTLEEKFMLEIPPKRARRATLQCLLIMFIVGVLGARISEAASVVLAWDPNPDPQVIGYNVYRSESLGTFSVSPLNGSALVSSPTFTDSTAEWDRTYYYVVTAVNASGHESGPSGTVEAATGPYKPPSTPSKLPSSGGAPVTTSVDGYGQRWFHVSGASFLWGYSSDMPVSGDFDGDGQTDLGVYRPSDGTWWVLTSTTGFSSNLNRQWGLSGDMPVPADYDGDGRTDIAIYRPGDGTWWVLTSGSGFSSHLHYQWGVGGDIPVPADYDGDGRIDLAIYRPGDGTWWILTTGSGFHSFLHFQWGLWGDVPAPADYDGDGRTDIAIYRPSDGSWWVLTSSSGFAGSVHF
jgi:hypothetical protein